MPFKRVAINQGRQPRALVKGAVGWVCVCGKWGGATWISLSLAEGREVEEQEAEAAAPAL